MTTVEAEEAMATGRCTRRLVPIAGKNAKCPSSHLQEGLYIAGTATRTTASRTVVAAAEGEGIKTN